MNLLIKVKQLRVFETVSKQHIHSKVYFSFFLNESRTFFRISLPRQGKQHKWLIGQSLGSHSVHLGIYTWSFGIFQYFPQTWQQSQVFLSKMNYEIVFFFFIHLRMDLRCNMNAVFSSLFSIVLNSYWIMGGKTDETAIWAGVIATYWDDRLRMKVTSEWWNVDAVKNVERGASKHLPFETLD